jgi:adenylate cyclase
VTSILKKLSQRGITAAIPQAERRYVIFTNQAALLAGALTFVGAFQPRVMQVPVLMWSLIAQALIFAAIPVLLSGRSVLLSSVFFAGFAIASIAAVALLTGPESDQALYLIGVPLGAWFIFPPSRQGLAYATSAAAGLVLCTLELLQPASVLHVRVAEMIRLQTGNHIIFFIIMLGYAIYASRRTIEAEELLKAAHTQSEQLLLNVFPASIAEKLKQKHGSIADRFEEATILFADIVNFTVLAEGTSPVALVQLLDGVFSRFDELAGRYGLEKIKTIGDAYMVASGIPAPRTDHVEAMANMALDMLQAVQVMPEAVKLGLNIRIGIHTGPVVAGVIGQRRFAYDLWGDSVNTASRMESHGLPGRIQVSAEVHRRLETSFIFEARGRIAIKGKGELSTYFLLGRAEAKVPQTQTA